MGQGNYSITKETLPDPIMARKSDREDDEMKVNARLERLEAQVAILKDALKKAQVELADLHFGRRVSREQADDRDPEWF